MTDPQHSRSHQPNSLPLVLRLARWVAPRPERDELVEEWRGEIEAAKRAGLGSTRRALFAYGAIPHALWLRADEVRSSRAGLDLRIALRSLARRPAFSFSVVTTLAMGLAAAASVFALLDGVILRPPVGIEDPNRLVQIGRSSPDEPGWNAYSWLSTEALRSATTAFEGVEGYSTTQVVLASEDADLPDEAVMAHFVTGGWFELLGTRPATGRLIDRNDTRTIGGPGVVVLGHDLWQSRFAGDWGVVGRRVDLSGDVYEVVGVAPKGFGGIHTVGIVPQLFIPATSNPGYRGNLPFDSWQWAWLNLVGRLAPGVDFEGVVAETERLGTILTEADPDREPTTVHVVSGVGVDPVRSESIRQVARATSTIAALLLLLTIVTVANLLLSRALSRGTDTRVRMALGASRAQVVRHYLAESIVLAAAAGLLVLPLLFAGTEVLPHFIDLPLAHELAPDRRILGALGIALATATLLFGWIPGRIATRAADTLPRKGARSSRATGRLRSALVLAQFSISLAFLASAGLLGRSVLAAWTIDPGFAVPGLWAGFTSIEDDGIEGEERGAIAERLVANLRARPDVRSAAWSTQLPIAGGQSMGSLSPLGSPDVKPQVEMTGVGEGWFRTFGVELLAGRAPSPDDPDGVVVSRQLAEVLFPGVDPIGQRFERGWYIVGVAPDVRMRSVRAEGNPAVWYYTDAPYYPRIALSVSMQRRAEALGGSVLESAQSEVDPTRSLAVVEMRSAVVSGVDDARRLGVLLAIVAALAMVLTAAGIFGVAAQRASERRHEFGIRLTLGADPTSLPRLLLGGWAALCFAGLVLGGIGAVATGRALGGLLFRTAPADPWALGTATILLAIVALGATWWPAAKAARVDPLTTLREAD